MSKSPTSFTTGAAAHDRTIRMGMEALADQKPAEAEALARKVLATRPQHPEALHLCGLALLAQGRPAEALVPLEAAVRTAATPAAATDLAAALQLTGHPAEAVKMLEHAARHEPPYLPAFHDLGVLHYSAGRIEDAETVLRRGLEIDPASPELLAALANVLLERSQVADAKLMVARAIANAPGHPGAYFGMGNVLIAEGDFAGAAKRFRHVLTLDPKHGGALFSLGTCLLDLGQTDDGVAKLRAAVQARPQLREQAIDALMKGRTERAPIDRATAEALLAAR